jgi:glycosyltransferase involved in cell wall biosynthesis
LYLLSKHNKSLFEKDTKGALPTIAWFSPIKPIQSGISSYSHEIINSLSNYYKIFIFIDDGYEPDIDVKNNKNTIYLNYRCFWILSKLFLFKENIFQVGNSRYHTYMSHYIYKYSGLVFLHDSLSIDRISPDFISNQKNTCIVHSIHAQEQVKDKYPCSNLRVLKQPIKIPASISPQQKNLLKVKMGFNVNTFIVSFFGIISEEKLVYEVCRDFYNKLFSDIELNNIFILIIGYSITDQRLIQLINLMSSHQNTKNRILIDINVSDEKLYNYLYITDICMNLRKSSRGETSSALLRAMSCGIPSIITDIDSFCEFPDDSVIKIPPNMEDFSNLLKQLYYNKGMLHRISQKSREYIVNNHTIQHVADEYRQLINKNRQE